MKSMLNLKDVYKIFERCWDHMIVYNHVWWIFFEHNYFCWYSSRIYFYVFPLLSTINLPFMMKDPMVQTKKNRNSPAGFWLGSWAFMIGKSNMTSEAAVQLTSVAYGTNPGDTISGMYSQMTGPNDSPKLAINMTRAVSIRMAPKFLSPYLTKNPIVIIARETLAMMQPSCNIVFLPTRSNT